VIIEILIFLHFRKRNIDPQICQCFIYIIVHFFISSITSSDVIWVSGQEKGHLAYKTLHLIKVIDFTPIKVKFVILLDCFNIDTISPQIDDNFIANYQMNYGATASSEQPASHPPPPPTTDINSKEYADWYQQYYGNEADTGQSDTGQEVGDTQSSSEENEDLNDDTKEYSPKEYFDYYTYYYGHEAAVEYLGYDYYKQQGQGNAENDEKDKGKKRKKAEPQPQQEGWLFLQIVGENLYNYITCLWIK